MMSFVKNFQNFVFQEGLFARGDRIVVGVSGGPDSTGLLVALDRLKKKYDLKLLLVHINYGLRGKDSEKDEKFVRELAEELGLGLEVVKYDSTPSRVLGTSKGKFSPKGENLEQAMREFRYRKFEEIRAKNNYDLIAVGHTKDDQAETMLMNLIRGAGIKGLKGMKSKSRMLNENPPSPPLKRGEVIQSLKKGEAIQSLKKGEAIQSLKKGEVIRSLKKREVAWSLKRGEVIRPLLGFTKKEILTFLKKEGVSFRIDKSNLDQRFFRNRIRGELLPLLEEEYNPAIKERLSDLAQLLTGAEEEIEKIVEKKYNECVTGDCQSKAKKRIAGRALIIELDKFLKLSKFLQGEIFLRAMEKLKGNRKDVVLGNFRELEKIIKSKKGKRQKMKIGKIRIEKVGERLILKGIELV